MELSIIYKLFEGKIDCIQFKKLYRNEFEIFAEKKRLIGSSVFINIKDDIDFVFRKEYLLRLCDFFLSENLNSSEIEYIADCLLLSENISYENDDLFDQLNLLSDQGIDGELTKNDITSIRNAVR